MKALKTFLIRLVEAFAFGVEFMVVMLGLMLMGLAFVAVIGCAIATFTQSAWWAFGEVASVALVGLCLKTAQWGLAR